MLYDDCKAMCTHMDPVWRCEMFGIWACDPRGEDIDGGPFEIPLHGCGLMSCRKEAWAGFNPAFRAFGGEEGYIQDKFRKRGDKTFCLPFLRWLHRFGRPRGVSYPLDRAAKLRNYLLGRVELGRSYDDVLEHFAPLMRRADMDHTLQSLGLPSIHDHWFKPARRKTAALAGVA
jgi:hypothetical protein